MVSRACTLVLLLLLSCFSAIAQKTETGVLPDSLVLNERWDYKEYTDLVVPTINWLIYTPADSNKELRRKHSNFLMLWMQKSDDIIVNMPDFLVNFQNTDRELYFIYTGGWIKHVFETGDTNYQSCTIVAIKTSLDFYDNNPSIKRSDYMDHLLGVYKEGKLPQLFDTANVSANTLLFLQKPDRDDFKANENYFNFKYTGINLINTRALRYRYKLKGYYDKWISTQEEQVTFPNLPPGDYDFTLQASTSPDFSHTVEEHYKFSIAMPLYKQWWFITLLVALLIVAAIVYTRRREQQLTRMASLQHERVTFEYEYLKSQVNPHFLFNSLNTLASLIEENPKTAVAYTTHLSDLYRNMLAHPEDDLVYLAEELEILNNYLHIQKSRFGEALQLKLDIPDKIRTEKKIVYLALQLLVENAIKHNTVSREHPLLIHISATEDMLTVTNPMRAKMSKEKSNGMGLVNISKRYALTTKRPVSYGAADGMFIVKLPLL